ncbi:MAG: helix-turn-helix domain-containing protein, partial [Kofleriaceae bacterium]|nr:helix-turn-helix domain-containing protein [Kofleriaceae bacterium]
MKKNQQQSDRAELLAAVKRGESVAEAARRLWVPKSTAYNWVRSAARAELPLALTAQPRFVELVAEAMPRTALVVRV